MEAAGGSGKGAVSGPTLRPVHDLSGVWNMRATPAQRKFLGSTYTLEAPEMTPWGEGEVRDGRSRPFEWPPQQRSESHG